MSEDIFFFHIERNNYSSPFLHVLYNEEGCRRDTNPSMTILMHVCSLCRATRRQETDQMLFVAAVLFLQRMRRSAGKWLTASSDLHRPAERLFFFFHLHLLCRCDKNTSVGVFTVCSPARMFHTCCHTHTHTHR